MLESHKLLVNFVYSENKKSINWLKRAGFSFEEPKPYGEFGNLFQLFYKAQDVSSNGNSSGGRWN